MIIIELNLKKDQKQIKFEYDNMILMPDFESDLFQHSKLLSEFEMDDTI